MTTDENSRLERIERKISDMRLDLSAILQRLDREVEPEGDDHETRLRAVESRATFALGAIGAISFIGAAIGAWQAISGLLH